MTCSLCTRNSDTHTILPSCLHAFSATRATRLAETFSYIVCRGTDWIRIQLPIALPRLVKIADRQHADELWRKVLSSCCCSASSACTLGRCACSPGAFVLFSSWLFRCLRSFDLCVRTPFRVDSQNTRIRLLVQGLSTQMSVYPIYEKPLRAGSYG